MSTVVLTAYSIAYPNISNDIRVDISTQAAPSVIIATQTDTASGHPARIWSFPGLPRTNLIYNMNEIDSLGTPVRNLAYFDVFPDAVGSILVRDDEQITVDVTPGLVAGATSFTFDGTGGTPDYRGWTIVPARLGYDLLADGIEYSWSAITGRLDLLQAGDVFIHDEIFNIHFNPQNVTAGGSVSNFYDYPVFVKTADYTLQPSDFGGIVVLDPSANYMELTLCSPLSTPDGRPVKIQMKPSATMKCCKIINSYTLNYSGALFLAPGEEISIYSVSGEFFVFSESGNMKTVGSIVFSEKATMNNAIRLNGQTIDKYQFARLYDYVLSLLSGQRVSFDSWTSGNNKYKFSLADSANISNADKFKVPDRRDLYIRSEGVTFTASTYLQMMIQAHKHATGIGEFSGITPPFGGAGFTNKVGLGKNDNDNDWWYTNDGSNLLGSLNPVNAAGVIGTETRPNSIVSNMFILI